MLSPIIISWNQKATLSQKTRLLESVPSCAGTFDNAVLGLVVSVFGAFLDVFIAVFGEFLRFVVARNGALFAGVVALRKESLGGGIAFADAFLG